MSDRRKWGLFVAYVLVLALAGLALLGVRLGSDWSTFVPDLIIGIVGASGIGLALFALQESAERRRGAASDVSRAYGRLLDALTVLRTLDFTRDAASSISVAATRMLQLYEAVAPDDEALGNWLEANRQFGLYRALTVHNAIALLSTKSPDAVFEASAPFHRWVAEFGGNIRLWRIGKVSTREMIADGAAMEGVLREAGAWRESHYLWRDSK